MSYNEIIEYYIPKNIRRLLETGDESAQKLAYQLSLYKDLVVGWANLAEWYAIHVMKVPPVPLTPYTSQLVDEFEYISLLDHADHTFKQIVIRLIDEKQLPYDEEIYTWVKTFPSLTDAQVNMAFRRHCS